MPGSMLIEKKNLGGEVTVEITVWNASPDQQKGLTATFPNCFRLLEDVVQSTQSSQKECCSSSEAA